MEEKDTSAQSYAEEIYENLTDLTSNLMILELLCRNYPALCRKYGEEITCYSIDCAKKFADDHAREIASLSQFMVRHTLA